MPHSVDGSLIHLLRIRDTIGTLHGNEDLSLLLYTLVRREKPRVIVELGTGCGVTAMWMGQAVKENGAGSVWTVDDGQSASSFLSDAKARLRTLSLNPDAFAPSLSYQSYLTELFAFVGLSDIVKLISEHIDLSAASPRLPQGMGIPSSNIDLLFSDFAHGPDDVLDILASFLPCMSETSLMLIDSAPTHLPSFLALEQTIAQLNRSKMPRRFLQAQTNEQRWQLMQLVMQRRFTLLHLHERKQRAQNSTALIRIEPNHWGPSPEFPLH